MTILAGSMFLGIANIIIFIGVPGAEGRIEPDSIWIHEVVTTSAHQVFLKWVREERGRFHWVCFVCSRATRGSEMGRRGVHDPGILCRFDRLHIVA